MALSNEDKKDVSKAYGKALANKVAKVTRDGKTYLNKERKNNADFMRKKGYSDVLSVRKSIGRHGKKVHG